MAEQQNNAELPKETVEAPAPATTTTEATPVEAKPVDETAAPAVEAAAATEEKPAEAAAEEPKAEEEKKEEVTPIEEGQLSHKAQGLSFPKNLIASKEFFFFGNEAVEPKTLEAYQRSEKSAEVAHNNVAWASQTGKGLLFVGDKKAPTGIINLSDATEPEVDGSNKFTLNSKGNKHTFKASSTAERDNWVSQLKLKIAEAKELATSVTESETYKQTLESFKPAKKEEKPVEVASEEPKAEETAAEATEAPKEEAAATEEAPKAEETKVEEPKRRSASRKRGSFFGFGKKEGAKSPKEEANKQLEETPAAEPATEVAAAVAPAAEEPAKEEAAAPAADEKTEEAAAPVEKPAVTKRNSIFGSVFGKKEKKAAEPKGEAKAVEVSDEAAAPKADDALPVVAGDAPVIPPVEATTPLEASTASPATAPVETTDVTATTPTVEEPKKDVKEKRKSSLPFAFGKRDKSPAPAEGEKAKSSSPFSKFRDTIKGKKPAAEKPAEEKTEEAAAPAEETKAEETAAEAAPATEEVKAEADAETKPETVAATTPAPVAASA